jgi:23S rRNA (adenine2030-N6)-methyltransferase
LNYRHIYHAGNICDVVKHAVLTLLVGHLRAKDKGFTVLDTHAGAGLYDLDDPRARKTDEAATGIRRLFAAEPIPELADYVRVVRALNPEGAVRHYPGSPVFARHLLRPQDRLMACELHPEDARALKRRFFGDKQVQVHRRDGYEALQALMPPEKRGLALIDPPFETPDEFARLTLALAMLHRLWPHGQMAIWYPIKERPAIWRFHEALMETSIPKLLCAEFIYDEETRHDRLNGCGFIIVNPPWQFDSQLVRLFPALHRALQTAHQGSVVKSLANEVPGIIKQR